MMNGCWEIGLNITIVVKTCTCLEGVKQTKNCSQFSTQMKKKDFNKGALNRKICE
jgi:hypothetical protein